MLDRLLEGYDLTTLHTMLALIGAGLALYVMQLTSREHEDISDPPWLQWARRFALASIALSFLWSLIYSLQKAWQPWPPEIAVHLAIISMLAVRALAINARIWREGHKPGSVTALELSKRKVV